MVKLINIIIISILVFILPSCSKPDIKIRIGVVAPEAKNADPFDSSNSRIPIVMDAIYDFLFYTIGTGEVIPKLVKEVYFDGNDLIIKINTDILFHDNSHLNSHDIVNTFNRAKNNQDNISYKGLSNGVESIDIIDLESIRVRFKKLVPPDLSLLAHIPIIKDIEQSDIYAGTGPYRLQSLQSKLITLEKFENYFQNNTGPSIIEYKLYDGFQDLLKAVILNEVDFTTSQYFSIDDIELIENTNDYRLQPYIFPFCYMIILNTQNQLFSSKSVRRALSATIDREEIVNSILKGRGEAAYSPIFLSSDTSKAQDKLLDIQNVHSDLKKSGWKYNEEKIKYYDQSSEPVDFELLCPEENVFMRNAAQNFRKQLKNIGIEMNVQYHSREIITASMAVGDYDAAFIGLRADSDTNSLYQFWHSNSIENGLNMIHYRNGEVDQLIENLTAKLPVSERLPIYGQLEEAFIDDPPAIFLFYREQYLIISQQYSMNIPYPQKWYYFIHEWNIRQN